MSPEQSIALDRREFLTGVVGTAAATSLSGCSAFSRDDDGQTNAIDDERARELAEEYAPTLVFDDHEQWFPTDPRPYEREQEGATVVDGFDALDGYTERSTDGEAPPDPTVFYHVMEYEKSPLAVVQFWYYSVFDQFTTNFHWHDWEVLHVFVDTDTEAAQLFVASSHSGRVPNNEFLDPGPDLAPRVLSELGSHSSALSLNDIQNHFQRFAFEDTFADITNSAIEGLEDIANIPIAYGLPRDEGSRLPYTVPELDGQPLYEHDRLPSVEATDLIADQLTIRSFADLTSPPGDLPERSTGLVFEPGADDVEGSVAYDLVSTTELEHIEEFTGPQLSFEFAVPDYAEDAIASHITTVGVPWDQARYTDPAADITEPNHRAALSDRYDAIAEPSPSNMVLASLSEMVSDGDAPEGEGLTTGDLSVEAVALLESEPMAIPTFGGLAVARDVPAGDHRLTVNGAGVAPHSESISVDEDETGPTAAGVEGQIPLVARENAVKLDVDPSTADSELSTLAIEDDFAGRIYEAPLTEKDGVYLHRGGAFTSEVRDTEGAIGAYRVNPDEESRVRLDELKTGKGSLANYLADVATETGAAIGAIADEREGRDSGGGGSADGKENAVRGLARALEAVAEAARRAAERAEAGNGKRADESLDAVRTRLERVETRLREASGDLPGSLERATDNRLEQLDRRSEQAKASEKL